MKIKLFSILLVIAAAVPFAIAQDGPRDSRPPALEPAQAPNAKSEPGLNAASQIGRTNANPLARIQDEPGLPRVLLIGDSISIGYTLPVRERLKGIANVHRVPDNAGSTAVGLKHMSAWLGKSKWDVIHFNFGIHDAKFLSPGKQQVPYEQYEENLRQIVKILQGTGARLIWCTTTSVPPGELIPPRQFDDVSVYNRIAEKIMREFGVTINDLNGFIRPQIVSAQKPQDVHFTPAGSELLATQVSAAIKAELLPRTPMAP